MHARGGEMTSGAIAARFEHSWPTISQHLRVLQEAGLVSISMRGRERVYRLETGRLLSVTHSWLGNFGEA
jgi:DNA-binding transcriptional ArsR family regulator